MAVLIGWWLVCGCRGALIFGRTWEDLVDLVNVEYYTKFCAMATCHYVTLWICRMFGPIAPTTGFYGRVLWTNYGGSRKQEKLSREVGQDMRTPTSGISKETFTIQDGVVSQAFEDPSVDRELRSLLPHATGVEYEKGMLGFWGETGWNLGFLDGFCLWIEYTCTNMCVYIYIYIDYICILYAYICMYIDTQYIFRYDYIHKYTAIKISRWVCQPQS